MELTNTQWSNLFHDMEQQSKRQADSMNEKYISLGEIDDPSEMLSDIHVKLFDIQGIGKTNWLKSTITGKYIQVGDCTLDNLYNAGKIINHDYESYDPEYEKYSSLSKEEKISYRMNNQGVSKQLAKELVYDEFGYSWEHSFEYKITEVIGNTLDDSKEEQTYTLYIDADTELEANEKLSSEIRKEGETVCTFTKYPKNYKPSISEILTGGKLPRHKKYVVSVVVELISS
jgi:hypothetical protein